MRKFEVYRRVLPSVEPIIFRNVFLLVNAIIFCVVVLLFVFGNPQAGLFLGIVFVLNTLIATIQDVHAQVLLEKLQMLTALQVVRVNQDKTETLIMAEEIRKGDLLKLKLGDQVPCEGILISVDNLEISEALITGESDSFAKKEGDKIIAGAIITAGSAVVEAQGLFSESRLSVIAGEAKKYVASPSSIQTATNKVVEYSGYILLLVLAFVVVHGIIVHAPRLQIVTNAGALASTLVPQGLVVVITLLFAIGAANYSRRNVLFQEINATEKLGRIKNICIDKTGTLTDNVLLVEDMHIVQGFGEAEARVLVYQCIIGMGDLSETILAVKKYLEKNAEEFPPSGGNSSATKILNKLSFSSWRRYGGVEVEKENTTESIFVGAPDIFLERISNAVEKKWLENILQESAEAGKRVLCVVRSDETGSLKNISENHLSVIAIFVFHNTLREGIVDAIKFFQNRGVEIRVLSGDNAQTVRAVAKSVGIKNPEKIITGKILAGWSDPDFAKQAGEYTIFAEVLPEHKVKLVESFKKDGFTAMVGDGVNDALAMKKSDLGIAMWGGAPVTRQLADVILMTNSFSDLPGAVRLADHFIQSIEVSSGVYINISLVGLFFFIILSIFGYAYPLTPLNITFLDYFTVGFATLIISFWAFRPSGKILRKDNQPFLKRVMPIVFSCAIVEAIGLALVYFLSPTYLKNAPSNTIVLFAFILFGFLFLILSAKTYCVKLTKQEKLQIFILGVFEILLIYFILQIPFLVNFFNITTPYPAFSFISQALTVVSAFGLIQYFLARKFFWQREV